MITKKKGLCLRLLLSLLGMGNMMQADGVLIRNETPYKVTLKIRYHDKEGCSPDSKTEEELAPYASRGFFSEACDVKSVQAKVYLGKKLKKKVRTLKFILDEKPEGIEKTILVIKKISPSKFAIEADEE